jgi:hypothetical protein
LERYWFRNWYEERWLETGKGVEEGGRSGKHHRAGCPALVRLVMRPLILDHGK